MASVLTLIGKFFKGQRQPWGPSLWPEIVNISSVDYTPSSGGLFRGINASVAGQITIVRPDGQAVPVYVSVGWNPQGGTTIKHAASGDSATILAAELDITGQ